METLTIPGNEVERLKDLDQYSILNTLPEKEYDEITRIASYICQTPVSLINIIDEHRQWSKSNFGAEEGAFNVAREDSFCTHTINMPNEILVVSDAREDERFYDNSLVTGTEAVVFYAGIPLVSPQGFALGALCVMDNKPRNLSEAQVDSLKALANQVISLLELRRSKKMLEKAKTALEEKNHELEKFAYVVAHDIKSPMNNITGLTKILTTKYAVNLNGEMLEICKILTGSTERLKGLVDGILEHSRSEKHITENHQEMDIRELLDEIIKFSGFHPDCHFILPTGSAKYWPTRQP
jgi:signal transduction histidine kinase